MAIWRALSEPWAPVWAVLAVAVAALAYGLARPPWDRKR